MEYLVEKFVHEIFYVLDFFGLNFMENIFVYFVVKYVGWWGVGLDVGCWGI